MNKLLVGIVATVAAAVSAVAVAAPAGASMADAQVGNAPLCTVKAIGERDKAFTVKGNTASVRFEVKGPKDCKVRLSTVSFYAPSMNGMPYSAQIRYDRQTNVFSPGEHSMDVRVPSASNEKQGCYYQLDLTYGISVVTPVLAYAHGEIPNCKKPVENVQVCNPATGQIITVKKSEADQYEPVDSPKCKDKNVEVCEIATGKKVTIKNSALDNTKYTTDMSKCVAAVVAGDSTNTPSELPSTGPEAVLGGLVGSSALGYSGYSYLLSRRRLMRK